MTTEQIVACPNCGAKIKDGVFGTVKLLTDKELQLVREFLPEAKAENYCNKCGSDHRFNANNEAKNEKTRTEAKLEKLIDSIPVVSAQNPIHWDYEIVAMVTGQSTTGTGVFSEFSSSFTDFFGTQSKAYNKKIKSGEDLCFTQLRIQAMDLGANAVISTDIDYAEVGGEKGMLLVCMAGTAVRLKDTTVIGLERSKNLDEAIALNDRIKYLASVITN